MTAASIELPLPHAGQARVIREAKRYNVLKMGRRWGKTTLGLLIATEPAFEGHPVGWFAPTYQYLMEPWRDITRLLAPAIERASLQERRIELKTGGVIDFWTLENQHAGRGRKYRRTIVDEAGFCGTLEETWSHAIRPTLADLKGDAWFLGTPRPKQFFLNLFRRGVSGERGWKSWNLPTSDNPAISRAEIAEAKASLPEMAFQQEYLGIESDEGGNPFGLAAIQACIGPLARGPVESYGVDLAKSQDWTVCLGLNAMGQTCHLERWQSPWQETTTRLERIIGETPATIDSTGVGDPIVEALQRTLPNVAGFKFSGGKNGSKQQLMEGLALAIQRTEIEYPAGWLVNELEAFGYEYTANGVRYSAPHGLHDDGVCALALAVHGRRNIPETPTAYAFGTAPKTVGPPTAEESQRLQAERMARFFGDD